VTSPLVLLVDGDIAMSLGRLIATEVAPGAEVIAIDGVELQPFDYVDIGDVVQPANVVPLVVKSLVF
jgi:ethanolamine utilization protein EutA